ncbi:hypothetical protein QFC21_004027 [Naganishia friedmannii]|uniref:Uncharacterized protein n=1 Tax=Naganishia friedmannii TaxID=89922 RepID=A0ACC2VJ27_9TREE|nr:hypothetical protein QFC21_004027 [Naganishia friedmannii]
MPATTEGNPLSPDSQAFMDMLERHLSEHDNASTLPGNRAPSVSDAAAFPPSASAAANVFYPNNKRPSPPSLSQPQQQQQSAPSPQTMAALINILQIQAQAQGMNPQEQQRHLVNVLNSFPSSVAYNQDQQVSPTGQTGSATVNRQAQPLQSLNTSALLDQQQQQQQLNPYPYPGVDTPEHSGPGSTSANGDTGKRDFSAGIGSTDSNGNTPPISSPDAITHANSSAAGTSRGDKEAVEKQRRAVENALEAQARSQLEMLDRRWEAGPSKGNNTSASVPLPAAATSTGTTVGSRKSGSGSSATSTAVADGPLVKRKAGDEEIEGHQSHRNRPAGEGEDSNEDDSEADDHESPPKISSSKRAGGSNSRRKSTAAGDAAAGGKGDEGLDEKALKRKNQNRAAQKAFRERREARVKDLEDKVGELEAKNAGHEFENENLRQLLAKLQQENMSLKTTAFTFSMPMHNMPPPPAVAAKSQSPPTLPDQSFATAEALRNLVERFSPPQPQLPPPHPLQHRGDSTSSSASGISNTVRSAGSAGASGPGSAATTRSPGELSAPGSASASPLGAAGNNVFNPEPFNAFASTTTIGQGSANASQSLQQQGSSSRNTVSPVSQSQSQGPQGNSFAQFAAAVADSNMSSNQSNNALHQHRASVSPPVNLDQNMRSMTDTANASAGGAVAGGNEMDWQNLLNNNFTMLAQAPEFMSFSDDAAFGNFAGFSDIWPGFTGQDFSAFAAADEQGASGDGTSGDMNMAGIQSTLLDGDNTGAASNLNQFNTLQSKSSTADDALMNMADDNMEEFLRSLGAGGSGTADDVFDMNFIEPSSDEAGAATVDSSGNLGSDLYKQFIGYKNSPAASNAGASSSLSSAPSSILSPSNYFTTSPDPSSASSVSAQNSQNAALPNSQGSSSEYPQKQVSTSSNNESAFRVGTFGGGAMEQSKPVMVRRDGTVVRCDKMWAVVAEKIPINSGFDLDDLCDRFKQKAVCTGQGPHLKEEEADVILAEYAAERQRKQQMQHQQQQQAAAMANRSQTAVTNNAMFFQ